jgi:acyl-CoA thioesterase-1
MRSFALNQLYSGLKASVFKPPTPFTYVAIGDSTVEGIGASHPNRTYANVVYANLKLSHKKAMHYNFGKSGVRIQGVLATQLEPTIAASPELVTISVGVNDIIHFTKLSTFRQKLTLLIETLQQETEATIVLTNIPNFSLMRVIPILLKPIAKFQINRFNKGILEIAESHGVVHIDTYKQSTVFATQFPEAVCEDSFHPSDFGYALWGNTIVTAIQGKLTPLKPLRSADTQHLESLR